MKYTKKDITNGLSFHAGIVIYTIQNVFGDECSLLNNDRNANDDHNQYPIHVVVDALNEGTWKVTKEPELYQIF